MVVVCNCFHPYMYTCTCIMLVVLPASVVNVLAGVLNDSNIDVAVSVIFVSACVWKHVGTLHADHNLGNMNHTRLVVHSSIISVAPFLMHGVDFVGMLA